MSTDLQVVKAPLEGEVIDGLNKKDRELLWYTSQLEVGEVFKNYKHLCETLRLPIKTGKAKQIQLKNLERFLQYEKQGHKIVVTEVYEEPLPKVENRGKNLVTDRYTRPSFFVEGSELQNTILLYLMANHFTAIKEEEEYTAIVPCDDLYCETGLCTKWLSYLNRNREYMSGFDEKYKYSSYYNIATDTVYKTMRGYTITALNQLQKKGRLRFNYWYSWVEHKYDEEHNVVGVIYHTCTDSDVAFIDKQIQLGIEWWNSNNPDTQILNISQLYIKLNNKQLKEVYNYIGTNIILANRFPKFEYFFRCYKIIYSEYVISAELQQRGFTRPVDLETLDQAYKEYLLAYSPVVNSKFYEKHLDRLEKARISDLEAKRDYEKELEEYNRFRKSRQGCINRDSKIKEPKQPYTPLASDSVYTEAKDLLDITVNKQMDKEMKQKAIELEGYIEDEKKKEKERREKKAKTKAK